MKKPVPDQVILGLLCLRPMHGYELLERFRKREHLGRIWTMSTSQIYAVLKRLAQSGAIVGEEVEVPDAPSKLVYAITAKGENQLNDWLYEENPSTSIHLIRVLFLSKIYICMLLGLDINKIVEYQKLSCRKQLNKLIIESKSEVSPIEGLTIQYVIGHIKATINWLEVVQNSIKIQGLLNRSTSP
jgi:DNA-binding PadR family transcriptional regulator